jgi:hypothetical protein
VSREVDIAGGGEQPHPGHRDTRRRAQGEGAVAAQQQRLAGREAAGRGLGELERPEQDSAVVHGYGFAEPRGLAVQRDQ